MKKVTVLLATHNSEKYLRELLDSVTNQTCKVEIVVSDDGSSDSTQEILSSYQGLTVLKSPEPLKSARANFMFLLKNAPKSDYYMFCDHDDVWESDKVEKTLAEMLKTDDGSPALVHTDLAVADERLATVAGSLFDYQKITREQDLAHTLIQNNVTGCTAMINEPLRALASEFPSDLPFIMHDWLLAILAQSVGRVAFVDEATIKYRQHASNEVGAKSAGSLRYVLSKIFDKSNRESLKNTYRQAQSIASVYGDKLGSAKETVLAYAEFLTASKVKKLKLCKKYGFYKNTFVRRIGQIIYM